LAIVHEAYGNRPAALKGKDMFNNVTDGILRVTRRVNQTVDKVLVHECELANISDGEVASQTGRVGKEE
jgi:hypothetical protein